MAKTFDFGGGGSEGIPTMYTVLTFLYWWHAKVERKYLTPREIIKRHRLVVGNHYTEKAFKFIIFRDAPLSVSQAEILCQRITKRNNDKHRLKQLQKQYRYELSSTKNK